MKSIFGFCPCCGDLFRLSDATLFTKTPPPKTDFDRSDAAFERLRKQTEQFAELEEAIQEKATRRGQMRATRRLRKMAPFFVQREIVPQDVKVLFHPVEYIVFRGLSNSACTSLLFVDHPPESRGRELLQISLKRAINSGNFEFQTFRVETNGRVVLESE
jgi:predicted Holliday junction resolvase-like endonuclease